MNKKKVATYLTIAALVFAIVAIFMGLANGFKQEVYYNGKLMTGYGGTVKFFDIIFNKENIIKNGFNGKSNAGLIIAFALTIIAIVELAITAVLNLTGKSSAKINKGLMVSAAVILIVLFVLMIASKAICAIPDEDKVEVAELGATYTVKNKLQAGPICWAVFSLVGGGCMIAASVLNKKAASK